MNAQTASAAAPGPGPDPWRPGTLNLPALPPLSVYVHLPWCLRKCPYCDFNSHVREDAGGLPEARMLAALRADLESSLPSVWGRSVQTVFIGGGTPSLFSPEAIAELIGDLRARLPLAAGCEITMEANPGTWERDRFRAFNEAGVNRLSIGVQSFDDAALARLGRVHDSAQARAAAEEAARVFPSFNLDLMLALPGQSEAELRADLQQAFAFAPPHLSLYQLTLEPQTLFARQPPPGLPDEDRTAAMLDLAAELAAAQGLVRYEVSAYARDGHRCAHNLNYWGFGDYLGLGPGAHGKISFAHRIVREVRWKEPERYMRQALEGQAVAEAHEVSRKELPFEFMLNALRLREGFALSDFTERTGLPPGALEAGLSRAESRGLLARDLHRAWPTARGYDLLSDLQSLFL